MLYIFSFNLLNTSEECLLFVQAPLLKASRCSFEKERKEIFFFRCSVSSSLRSKSYQKHKLFLQIIISFATMSSNFEADFIALSSRHVFSTPVDSAPNSVMIVNLFLTWLKFLSSRSSQQLENEMPRNQNKLLKGSPLFHMDEFEPEEWTFSGDHNETRDGKLPQGKGYLNFVAVDEVSAALGNAEVCFRQTCNKAVRSVNGTFRHGIIEGFADIVFVDNSRLMAVFEKGTLHGFAIEYNSEGRIVFIGHYENGKRTWDRSWLIDHNFNVACYNNKALIHFHKEDVFALQGAMERGLLVDQEDPEVKRVEAVDFEEYGYFMTLNFAIFGEKQMEEGYKLRFAPNLKEDTEKFKVQAAWLVFTRLDSKTPRAAIKNLPLLQQFLANSGENVTRSFPKTLGSACAKFKTCKPCAQGKQSTVQAYFPKYQLRFFLTGSLRERYLACYPGSGSKWLGEVLSHAIGLAGYGCQGTTPSPEFVPEASILIKTHHQNPKRWKGSFSVMSKYKGKKWSRWSENLDFR